MSKDTTVAVQFKGHYALYNPGEVARLDEKQAKIVLDAGLAVEYTEAENPEPIVAAMHALSTRDELLGQIVVRPNGAKLLSGEPAVGDLKANLLADSPVISGLTASEVAHAQTEEDLSIGAASEADTEAPGRKTVPKGK